MFKFEKVSSYEEYIWYDGPQVFSFVDESGSSLLGIGWSHNPDSYLYLDVDETDLTRYKNGNVSLQELVKGRHHVLIDEGKGTQKTVPVKSLTDLPSAGSYLPKRISASFEG